MEKALMSFFWNFQSYFNSWKMPSSIDRFVKKKTAGFNSLMGKCQSQVQTSMKSLCVNLWTSFWLKMKRNYFFCEKWSSGKKILHVDNVISQQAFTKTGTPKKNSFVLMFILSLSFPPSQSNWISANKSIF